VIALHTYSYANALKDPAFVPIRLRRNPSSSRNHAALLPLIEGGKILNALPGAQ